MNLIPNFNIYRQDRHLLIIFIAMVIAIIGKSYFNPDGYLSPDSTNYLRLAQNLLEGNGYYVSAYGNTGQDREFFSIWPVGYPTLIFITAKLTGFSVFWSSKFLNIILIGVILGIFRVLFKYNAYIYGLVFLFASYIEIFSYTWSETIFITALVWFAASIYIFITHPKRIIILYFSIIAASLLLFMSRYIGAFGFCLIFLLGIYYLMAKKDKNKAIILISISVANASIIILYLYHNYAETNFPTGMKRIPSPETNIQLFYMLLKAVIAEMMIPNFSISIKSIMMFFIQFSVISFLLLRYRNNILRVNNNANQQPIILSFVFSAIGSTYLFFIILMRWVSQFDEYSYRLLAPGSFLLFIGLIFFIQQRGTNQFFNAFKNFLILFTILSYLVNVPLRILISVFNRTPTYFESVSALENKYIDVEKNSIIIFAPVHLNYLYTGIQTRNPYCLPYSPYKEKWLDFIKRINGNNKNIYITIPEIDIDPENCDQSVVNFIKKYDKGTLVKLR